MARRRRIAFGCAAATMVATASAVVMPYSAGLALTAAVPTCHGHRATIYGSGTLVGTSHHDVIVGTLAGDPGSTFQLIRAGAGNDLVCAGPAGSRVFGGKGDDRLFGQGDYVGAFASDYASLSGTYGDVLNGGPGDDLLNPGLDRDQTTWDCVNLLQHYCVPQLLDQFSFRGATQGVTVDLKSGLATGQGHDRLVVASGWDALVGSVHDDVLRGTDANHGSTTWHPGGDEIYPLAGNDVVRARAGADHIFGTSGDDTVYGGADDDWIDAIRGNVTIFGGTGDDRVELREEVATDRVTVSGGAGQDHVVLGAFRDGDQVNGDAGRDHLQGSFGVDRNGDPTSDGALVGNLATGAFNMDGLHATYQGLEEWLVTAPGPVFITGSEGPDAVDILFSAGLTAHMGGGDDRVSAVGFTDDFVDGGDGTDTADLTQGSDVCINIEFGQC